MHLFSTKNCIQIMLSTQWNVTFHVYRVDNFFQDFQISNIGDKSTLTITEVFPEDEGHYSCKAVNVEGEITSTCQLLVEGRLHNNVHQNLKTIPNLLQGFHSTSYFRNKLKRFW